MLTKMHKTILSLLLTVIGLATVCILYHLHNLSHAHNYMSECNSCNGRLSEMNPHAPPLSPPPLSVRKYPTSRGYVNTATWKNDSHQDVAIINVESANNVSVDISNRSLIAVHSRIQNISNIVLKNGATEHHVYSAYYDSRPLTYRPAVMLFGYVKKRSQNTFYCLFRYSDNSTKCLGTMARSYPLIASNVWPESYFCQMRDGDRVPEYVMIGSDKFCNPSKMSSPIPVLNREKKAPHEGVGVCVHSCVYTADDSSKKTFQDMLQFLAMVKVLGAKVVTIYNLNIDHAVMESVLSLYPEMVEVVQWINLNQTLHYYGQRIVINDCIYRNMERVKYLAMIDLDEMILPTATRNWPEMLQSLEKSGKYASYTFSNNFFEEVKESSVHSYVCPGRKTSKYFVRFNKLPWPHDRQNTKMKMILKPEAVSETCIHDICKPMISGYIKTYNVPASIGLMAHYREPVPPWYIFGKGVQDTTALKFQTEVEIEMRRQCAILSGL